jgi:hypothetical protein
MSSRLAMMVGLLWWTGCDPSVQIGDPDAGATDAGAADAGALDAGVQIVSGCPRVLLGRSTAVTFSADTSALPDLVISNRLEWDNAPDDALEFIAAQAGNYAIDLTSSNANLGASAQEYHDTGLTPFTRAACPPAGLVVSIDGFYSHNQPQSPIALTEGQSMLIFISAPRWAAVKTGAYTLVVRRVP